MPFSFALMVEAAVKKFCNSLFLTLLIVFAARCCSASDIYIAQKASGSSTGADCSDAYAASWFNTAVNWGSSAGQIGPGTTVHVCGTITGQAGGSILTFQGSGTVGNPITLKFEAGASLSAPYCNSFPNGSGCLVVSASSSPRSYIVVDGGTPCGWTNSGGAEAACNGSIVNTASGSSLTYAGASTTGIVAEKCTGCEIKNLGIYNLYVESGGATTANPQYENCISYSGSNLLIHDNRMHDVGWCLFYSMQPGDTNIQIYQNEIYNTPHPMFLGNASGVSGVATNQFIYSNHFHDYANWNTSACTFHVEGIHSSGPSSAPFPVFNGLFIYNNYFGPNEGTCLFAEVYLSPNTNSAGSSALVNQSYVFNNVIEQNTSGLDAITIGGGNGNAVYNNTMVYDGSGYMGSIALNWSNISQNPTYTFTFENNASQNFYTFVNDDMAGSEGAKITANYNVYASCTDPYGGCLNAFISGGTSAWPTYQANAIRQELNSTPALLGSGSKCCSGSLNLNESFVPQAGSAVIGKGTNLYGICNGQPNPGLGALCFDASGVVRPTTEAWDAGAFQYSAQQKPAQPTVVKALVVTQ